MDTIEPRGGDYIGVQVNRAAMLLGLVRGGQILLSMRTQELVKDRLPARTRLRDLGEHRLRDLNRPERVFQLVVPDLADYTAVDRVLATILFTDIVSSTATAVKLGDQRWRALLSRHHTLLREYLPPLPRSRDPLNR